MSAEQMWKAAHHAADSAESVTRAAGQIDEAVHRLNLLIDPGYGGTATRLIELLELLPDQIRKFDDSNITGPYTAQFADNDQAGWFSRIYDNDGEPVCEGFDETNTNLILGLLNNANS
jgi:hypothetical protein